MEKYIQRKQQKYPNLNAGFKGYKNQNALKYGTPQERQELCKKFCRHIEQGYSDNSFPLCSVKTLKRYIMLFPSDIPSDVIEESKRVRKKFWIEIGLLGTMGLIKNFNANSWIFIMMNICKWKLRTDISSSEERYSSKFVVYNLR